MSSRLPLLPRIAVVGGLALAVFLLQCRSPGPAARTVEGAAKAGSPWDTVYAVLQHPRCVNCHPAGNRPLVGDDRRPHPQNVQRGPDGHGLFAMRCDACHQTRNTPGEHLPPGAPHWQLPSPALPLVFEGRSSAELCRQIRDPEQNGGKTPEEVLEHLAGDPLVLWGWNPGDGRSPVPLPHDELVAAVRAWVEDGCDCPEPDSGTATAGSPEPSAPR